MIIVLEEWRIEADEFSAVEQRIIYDAEQDQIIHQFFDPWAREAWVVDDISMGKCEYLEYFNKYLPNLRHSPEKVVDDLTQAAERCIWLNTQAKTAFQELVRLATIGATHE